MNEAIMADPTFDPGSVHAATVSVTVKPSGMACTAELWLSTNGTTKAATSGKVAFNATGVAQSLNLSITMPTASNTYGVYLDILSGSTLIAAYKASEDVVVSAAPPPQVSMVFDDWGIFNYQTDAGYVYPIDGQWGTLPPRVDMQRPSGGTFNFMIAPWLVNKSGASIAANRISLKATIKCGTAVISSTWQGWSVDFPAGVANAEGSFVFQPATDGVYTATFELYVDGVLCDTWAVEFLSVSSVAPPPPPPPPPPPGGYLLDRVVQWNDGSTEHVQIDTSGNFYLDGQRRHLVGMDVGPCTPESADAALIDTELSYMKNAGMRVVACEPQYYGQNQESQAHVLLDKAKANKMFVVARIGLKWYSGFDNLTNLNFTFGGDTLATWVPRWCNYLKNNYPNVVAVCVENEIDMRSENNHSYTAANMLAYMQKLVGLLRANISIPLYTKFVGDFWYDLPASNDIKNACWSLVDIVGWDIYRPSVTELNNLLGSATCSGAAGGRDCIVGRMAQWGYTKSWWIGEFNGCSDNYSTVMVTRFTVPYLQAVFGAGCALAILWTSCIGYNMQGALFFNSSGNPVSTMQSIAAALPSLQAPY